VASLNEPGTVDVRGIAFPIPLSADSGGPISHAGQISWRRLDLAGLRSRIPYPIMAVYIVQSPDSALPRRPIRLDPPPLSNGPHLSYALQWFSFAVIAIVGGWLFAFGKVGSPIGRDPTTP
jgi:surfeit locus 1 family protein